MAVLEKYTNKDTKKPDDFFVTRRRPADQGQSNGPEVTEWSASTGTRTGGEEQATWENSKSGKSNIFVATDV